MTERWQADAVEAGERERVQAPEVSWALREVNRAGADVDHALAQRLRLRAIDYAALGHVMEQQDLLGPVELSTLLGISTGSGTELVDRLERAGHLRRDRHPQDRRRLVLHATDSAIGQVLGELGPLLRTLDALASDLTEEEAAVVSRYLRAAAQRMRDYAHDVPGGSAPA